MLNLAEELGNVSRACKVMGVSRDTFYRYQELVEDGGIDSLIDKSRRTPNLKNRVDEVTEQAVIDYAIEFPAHGQHRTSNELRKRSIFVSGSGVRSMPYLSLFCAKSAHTLLHSIYILYLYTLLPIL